MKNKLDGREYVVKKVFFKEIDFDFCLKVYNKDGNYCYFGMFFYVYVYIYMCIYTYNCVLNVICN